MLACGQEKITMVDPILVADFPADLPDTSFYFEGAGMDLISRGRIRHREYEILPNQRGL